MANQPTPPRASQETPLRNKGLIAGLIQGNQWLISHDHKDGYFWGVRHGGVGWLALISCREREFDSCWKVIQWLLDMKSQ